jgi:hypothetical protein
MRFRRLPILLAGVVLTFLVPPVFSQPPVTSIEDAHGGAGFLKNLTGYSISGVLHRPDGTSLPFTLMVQGDNSRFETNEAISIFNGDVQQWGKTGGQRSQARFSRNGAQEVYLSPFYVAARLDKFLFKATDKADRFTRKSEQQRFVNSKSDTRVIDLDFDKATHRLTAIAFSTAERPSERLMLGFKDYREYGKVWFPSKVTQYAGDRLLVTLEIVALDFAPVFSSDTFKITH